MGETGGLIKSVAKGSQLTASRIRAGDTLCRVNGQVITDLIDYQYAVAEEELVLEFRKANGKQVAVSVRLEPGEDLGIEFEQAVFDGITRCRNKCVFCFVDSLPEGLRAPLYVRDDDYRLSFLYGNFITLNHMDEEAIERIKTLNLSPLYVSVHTTNPALRKRLMRCARNENVLRQIEELTNFGITLHTQIVVTPGYNDGQELARTIEDLSAFHPLVASIGVVPVGRTRYSENDEMCPLRPFEKRDATTVRAIVEGYRAKLRRRHKESVVHLADEFYFMTGGDFPPEEEYDGYPQYENGIGIVRHLYSEIRALKREVPAALPNARTATVVTGMLAADVIRGICEDLARKVRGLTLDVMPLRNAFFGDTVTVTGLLTGRDLIAALKERFRREKGDRTILLPDVMLTGGRFLDEVTPEEIAREVGLRVEPFETGFAGFLDAIKRL